MKNNHDVVFAKGFLTAAIPGILMIWLAIHLGQLKKERESAQEPAQKIQAKG